MSVGSVYEYTYKDLTTKSGLGVSAPAIQAIPNRLYISVFLLQAAPKLHTVALSTFVIKAMLTSSS